MKQENGPLIQLTANIDVKLRHAVEYRLDQGRLRTHLRRPFVLSRRRWQWL